MALFGDLDLGVGGVSYVELLILYELWAGEKLSLEKAHPRYLRPGRPNFSVGCSFWSRQLIFGDPVVFIGSLMRSLCFTSWWAS